MAEFTPITTQEQFDAAIGNRLEREREKIRKEFGDYEQLKTANATFQATVDSLNTEKATLTEQITGLSSKVKELETASLKTNIAIQKGLPIEMVSRLSGETEEEITADAELLAKFVNKPYTPPLKDNEPNPGQASDVAFKQLLEGLNSRR